MPATVIAERVEWGGSITWFRENVRRLRPEHRPVDPADRLTWAAGDAAQCDLWFPPRKIPLEDGSQVLLPVLVIVAAHSRFITARMIPTRKTEDLLLGSCDSSSSLGLVVCGTAQTRSRARRRSQMTVATRATIRPATTTI